MTRRRIRDIRHDEFVAATIRGVHAHGFGRVTMAEIAKEAGSSAASIAYYFGSKEKLMEATMRHLLTLLKQAMLRRYAAANTARDRLIAVIDANFDDQLFTPAQCSLWVQFWSNAPYVPILARLHRINRARVQSHVQAEVKHLFPPDKRAAVTAMLQAYMDGVWLEAAQSNDCNPSQARKDAAALVTLLLQ
ncbi:transcriptional regulator BetI [uncultured Litoreibacter sp.]|uniref:choline-binding transcriptional repressor BetI n=1 Tax=uncultured Litoreibacter sp. TaxID=1392394 RepID=UPI002639A4C9|nr:transcriptional regulator BetI [uncultured Litoreibacter sp.]